MNISLPGFLKKFVDEQVAVGGYASRGEYVRELIRKDANRTHLRGLLLDGAASASRKPVNAAYFELLRQRVPRQTPD